jgi:hypothetical protein
MARDQLRHLKHADLAFAVKYRLQRIVGVNLRSLFLVLQPVLLDVIPKLLGQFGTRNGFRPDDNGKFIIRLNRSHEGGVGLAFGRSLGFRHRG